MLGATDLDGVRHDGLGGELMETENEEAPGVSRSRDNIPG
jgi:hypothetical protein